MDKRFFVYIMTNARNTLLYVGVTSDLVSRVYQRRQGKGSEFTSKYRVHKLVYYEACNDTCSAISREKRLKAGPRRTKADLVDGMNPEWRDLYSEL